MKESTLKHTSRKFILVVLGIFYFVFSAAFIFFQQSKNRPAAGASQTESMLLFTHTASQSNSHAQKIYNHRQRFVDVNRNVFTSAFLLFPLIGFFAFLFFAALISRFPVFRHPVNTSSFPAFLSVSSLRI